MALGTFGASTKRKLTCDLSPICSLGGAEHVRAIHVVNKSKIAKSLIPIHLFTACLTLLRIGEVWRKSVRQKLGRVLPGDAGTAWKDR